MADKLDWFLTGKEVASVEVTEVEFFVHPIIPKEGIVFLYGKFGAFKTALGLNVARAVATGSTLWNMPVDSTRVLFVEGDTPRTGIIPRIQKVNPNVANLDFAFVYPGIDVINPHTPIENKIFIEGLRAKHKANKYGLVVVDSLRSSHPLDDKDSTAATIVYRMFASIFPGAVIFLIHHDKKSKAPEKHIIGTHYEEEMDIESFSGSQAWINHATTSLKIRKSHGKDKEWVTIQQTKSQVGPIAYPIDVHVTDGIQIELAPTINLDQIHDALHRVSWKNMRSLDAALAEHFDVSERWARTHRIRYEREVGPIPRVGPLDDTMK
jgi:hypothetical protein